MHSIIVSSDLENIKALLNEERAIVVMDSEVRRLWGGFLPEPAFTIGSGEEEKRLETVGSLLERLLELQAGRDAFIAAIGGGVVCDITGFAASVYMRGVRFGFVPTTLLSQVDAAIGGKNGVDVGGVKNVAGTFTMPDWVFISREFLRTLPQREYLSGAAEMLKSFIIADRKLYLRAAAFFKRCNRVESLADKDAAEELGMLAGEAARIKCAIVGRDPYEKGERRLLNLGHTYGHAIEMSGCGLSHGEAVAAGIILAARLSVTEAGLPADEAEMLGQDFAAIGLPTSSPVPLEELDKLILNDKKRDSEGLHFIAIEKIGKVSEIIL